MSNDPATSPGGANPESDPDVNHPKPATDIFSPTTVEVTDTSGVIFLGLIAIMLLVALLNALGRNRKLEIQLAERLRK